MPRRMLLLVAAGEFLGMTLWFSATAASPAIAREFALGGAARAWLTMAVQAGFVVGTLVTATSNLADAINPRRLFAIGAAAGAVMNASIVIAGSAGAVIALRFATGVALAWVYPPGLKIAAGWFRERRGTALGIVVGALTVGSAFPHLLNWLAAAAPWRVLVLTSSGLAVAGAVLVGVWVQDGPYVSASAPFDPRAAAAVLHIRGVRLAILGYLGHMWELYAMWTWIATFAAASLGAASAGSMVAFIAIASGSAGCIAAGFWADAWGRPLVAGVAMLVSAACALASPALFGAPAAVLLAIAVLWGFSIVADSAQFSAMVAEHSPRTQVGTALTLQTSAGFLLTMASMRLVPAVSAATTWRWAFVVLVPGPLLGAWAMKRLSAAPVRQG
ncbi:MAG TPA: MFS transporter [Vicinamibacterales bacterium]|nr:MFS transporter [Vicinamibacterales bacterium]